MILWNPVNRLNGRPKLSAASPLIYRICFGFGALNLMIAISLFPTPTMYLLSGPAWALVFSLLGGFGLTALFLNEWALVRYSLIGGLLIKTIWLFYLIAIIPKGGLGITALWLFLAYIQGLTVIYFPLFKASMDNER